MNGPDDETIDDSQPTELLLAPNVADESPKHPQIPILYNLRGLNRSNGNARPQSSKKSVFSVEEEMESSPLVPVFRRPLPKSQRKSKEKKRGGGDETAAKSVKIGQQKEASKKAEREEEEKERESQEGGQETTGGSEGGGSPPGKKNETSSSYSGESEKVTSSSSLSTKSYSQGSTAVPSLASSPMKSRTGEMGVESAESEYPKSSSLSSNCQFSESAASFEDRLSPSVRAVMPSQDDPDRDDMIPPTPDTFQEAPVPSSPTQGVIDPSTGSYFMSETQGDVIDELSFQKDKSSSRLTVTLDSSFKESLMSGPGGTQLSLSEEPSEQTKRRQKRLPKTSQMEEKWGLKMSLSQGVEESQSLASQLGEQRGIMKKRDTDERSERETLVCETDMELPASGGNVYEADIRHIPESSESLGGSGQTAESVENDSPRSGDERHVVSKETEICRSTSPERSAVGAGNESAQLRSGNDDVSIIPETDKSATADSSSGPAETATGKESSRTISGENAGVETITAGFQDVPGSERYTQYTTVSLVRERKSADGSWMIVDVMKEDRYQLDMTEYVKTPKEPKRRGQKRKRKNEQRSRAKRKTTGNLANGNRVFAQWKDGMFYPGTVRLVHANGMTTVDFDDGDTRMSGKDGVIFVDLLPVGTELTTCVRRRNTATVLKHTDEPGYLLQTQSGIEERWSRSNVALTPEQADALRQAHFGSNTEDSSDSDSSGNQGPGQGPSKPGPSGLSGLEKGRPPPGRSKRKRKGVKRKQSPAQTDQLGPLPSSAIFRNILFILTDGKKGDRYEQMEYRSFDKKHIQQKIELGGGKIIKEINSKMLVQARSRKLCFLIASGPCRTSKYLQALALGIPCVSHEFIGDCCTKGQLLDYFDDQYLLPAGFSLEDDGFKPIELRKKDDHLLEKMQIYLDGGKKFKSFWKPILLSCGAEVLMRLSSISHCDCVVSEGRPPTSLLRQIKRSATPIVSTEWAMQCIINGCKVSYNSHRQYQYNYADEKK